MGILQKIVGSAGIGAVEAIGGVMGKVFQNKQEKLSHEEVMARLAMQPQTAMQEISKIEAQHRSMFVAGARPFILWVCGAGLSFIFVFNPVIQWITGDPGPEMPTEAIMSMVVALLGLGGLRTVEKLNGRAK
jgi:hypothetical protein